MALAQAVVQRVAATAPAAMAAFWRTARRLRTTDSSVTSRLGLFFQSTLGNARRIAAQLSILAYTFRVTLMEGPTLPTIFGRYILLKSLGRGAMGDVHLARPISSTRGVPEAVVLKRLRGELVAKEAFVARFRHEATVAVSVDSPHVARVYDVGSVGSALYIVMQYVDGWPLSDVLEAILKSGRHASIASVLDLMTGGLKGLQALHTAKDPKTQRPLGAVHRDLSPKNLMVGEDGLLRLIDLGLGRSNIQDWKTQTGVVMGSVGYMPPEQARGERVDQRADLYAFAAVMFEMLGLRNYVKRGTIAEMMERSLKPLYVKPSTFRPDVPPELDNVFQRALAPTADDRYPTAAAFLRALETVVPPTASRGSMRTLLDELFGDTRDARARELDRLVALPLPGQDAFDTQPTKVFALGAGVSPDHDPSADPTALTGPGTESLPVRVRPVPGLRGQQLDWLDPTAQAPKVRAPTVSLRVLFGAVFVAAVIGGVLALSLQSLMNEVPGRSTPGPRQRRTVSSPAAQPVPTRRLGPDVSADTRPRGSSSARPPGTPTAARSGSGADTARSRAERARGASAARSERDSAALRAGDDSAAHRADKGSADGRSRGASARPRSPTTRSGAASATDRAGRRSGDGHSEAPRGAATDRPAGTAGSEDPDQALDRLAQKVDALRGSAEGPRRRALSGLLVSIRQARASQDAARKQTSLVELRRRLRSLAP